MAAIVCCVKALLDRRAILSSRDTTLRIWNIKIGDCEGVLERHTKTVRSFAISVNIMASGSYGSEGRVWNLNTNECLHVLKGHGSQVYSVAFDGTSIVTGNLDKTARVWDPATGFVLHPSAVSGQLIVCRACLAVLGGYLSLVGQIQLHADTLLTGDSGGELRIWSMKDFNELRRMHAHENPVISLQSDGSKIVSGGSEGVVKEWDLRSGEVSTELAASDAVCRVGYAGGRIAAVFSREGKVVLDVSAFYQ